MAAFGAQPEPAVVIENPAPIDRQEIVAFSLPLPRGAHRDLRRARVDGAPAACAPLIRWPDRSVAVARVHVRLELPANSRRVLAVEPLPGDFEAQEAVWPWPEQLPLETELEDPWGRRFVARFESVAGVASPTDTALVRRRHFAARHLYDGDGRQAFLGMRAYLTEFAGERRAELTLVLDNHAADGLVFGP